MDEAFEIDENFENDDIFSYVSEDDLVNFLTELCEKIGLPEELFTEVLNEM